MSTERRPPGRGIVGALANGLSLGVLLLILAVGALTIVVPAAVGGMPMTILTGSMRPHLPPGTLVVTRPVPAEEIGIGDVITFQIESGRPEVATHRVIERSIDSTGRLRFTTQGDANSTPDLEPVREVQIRGKVWYAIPYLGWVNQAIDGQTRSWASPALAGALLVYAAWTFGSGVRDALRGRRRARGGTPPESSAVRTDRVEGGAEQGGRRPTGQCP